MPWYTPPTDLGLLRATGSIPPPVLNTVRVESASASGYQFLTQGIRAETEVVINIQQHGDMETSQKGQYIQQDVVVNAPSGSYTMTTLSLDNGAGVGALLTIPTDEQGSFLTDEERALLADQAAQAAQNQQASYLGQAAPEYVPPPPPPPPTYETVYYYPPAPTYQPASGYQPSESAATISQPVVQSLPQEQAPPAGCETRTIHYFDDAGGDYFFDQHDSGGGSWS